MTRKLLRCGLGALAIGAIAGTARSALPDQEPHRGDSGAVVRELWTPVTQGLTVRPEHLLPAIVSATSPVRVVSTALDGNGRPVVTARTATDRASATALVRAGQQAKDAVGVELDVPVAALGTPGDEKVVDAVPGADTTAGRGNAADVPGGDDPLRSDQWDLAMIRVSDAWPRSTGAGVVVAVVDSGVDASHPDLAGQVLPGADFITGTEGPSTDPNGHGTHVAGTVAAVAGNGIGVAGVAPLARILPVRVLGANGGGYLSDVANGIVYAADHGADVINLSIGATSPLDAVTNAVAYARGKGVVIVAAAGNMRGSGSPTSYPAADAGVLAVAATDSADAVAGYSNRGGYVDVAAPGTDILSTFPPAAGAEYRRMSGTSMASPHAAAVAALLKARDRGLTPDQVDRAIESSAADLGTPGRDDDYGHGRIDAAAALAAITGPETGPAPTDATGPAPTVTDSTTSPADPAPIPSAPTSPAPSGDTPGPTPTAPTSTPTEPSPTEPSPTEPSPTEPDPAQPDPAQPEPAQPEPAQPDPAQPDPAQPSPRPAEPSPGTATPSPPAPVQSPAGPAPRQAMVRIVRSWAGELIVVLEGVDGQAVELQYRSGPGWTTALTYPAARVARINGLTAGQSYRVVVPGTARFAGAASGTLLW